MDVALALARLLLAAVFVVAGLAKLMDRAGARRALVDFGVPPSLSTSLGVLLSLVELAVAVALIPTATAWWAALAALLLLIVFIAAIGLSLARGRAPSCRCFGQIAAGPIGRSTLIRNAGLVVVTGFIVWQGPASPGASMVGWLGTLAMVEQLSVVTSLVGLVLLIGIIVLLVQVIGQQGRLLLRLDELEQQIAAGSGIALTSPDLPADAVPGGLPVGVAAPGFQLPDLTGQVLSLQAILAAEKPALLVFVDPDCGPCTTLLPEVGRWQREHSAALSVTLISRGPVDANRAEAVEHDVAPVLLQQDYEVADTYAVYATPSAVLVRPDGTIGTPLAGGVEPIRSLVAHTLTAAEGRAWAAPLPLEMANGHRHGAHHVHHHQPTAPRPPSIGDKAPSIVLPSLDDNPVDLADVADGSTLLLFWNPGCGFCQQALPALHAWEASPPPDAPRLLVVSAGSAAENRAQGLGSMIVLDQDFAAGTAYGATGTPSAVLIDVDGTVASDLAVGVPRVLALVGVGPGRTNPATV
jgi:thiol-disulfide isomerase/thioredoxin/uncharacterized membrane protein YphA (DoxX/SURF4 family)